MKDRIRVAIVGVGNCASSLIQGIGYYRYNSNTIGLMNYDLEGLQTRQVKCHSYYEGQDGCWRGSWPDEPS